MEEALATLDEAMDRCLSVLLAARTSEELVGYLDRLHGHVQRVVAMQAALVRELEVLDVPRRHGATSTQGWLRSRYRISPGVAKRLETLAHALATGVPIVNAALAAGTINAEQACVIAEAAAGAPAEVRVQAEEHLVAEATTFGPDDLGRLGERVLEHVAPELLEQQALSALERAERIAHTKRELHLTDIAGTSKVRIHGLLDREGAARLRAALDPLSAPRPKEDEQDPRTPGQRRADALVEVCQLVNACGKLPRNGGDRPQVVVTIDYDQLRNGLRTKRGAGMLHNGTQLSPADVRRLACDAEVIPIVLDGTSQVLDVGRERRSVSGGIRRALVVRDKGCAFPGCGRPPRWCHAHHMIHVRRRRQNLPGKQRPRLPTPPPPRPPRRMDRPPRERPPRLHPTRRLGARPPRTVDTHQVGTSPPSMRKSLPVTLAVRSLANRATRLATSSGRLKRPVTVCRAASAATCAGSPPVAPATVCATPPSPNHSAVATGPGLTVLTRTPRPPTSFDNALENPASADFEAL